MFELPIPEDIYDFDSFNLRDIIENIQNTLAEIDDGTEKPKEIASWIKKAKKIHGMIALELEERKAVEEFEEFCQKGEDYLKGLDKNPYSQPAPRNSIPKQDFQPIKSKEPSPKKSPVKLEHSQISTASNTSGSKGYSQTNTEREQDSNSDFDTESRRSVMTLSEEGGSRIYNRMHHANKKKPGKNNKKNALFEFMKQTLEASRITDEKMAIGKSSVADVPTKKPAGREEEKSPNLQRRSKPSHSEAAANARNAHKSHTVHRPLARPDPNFNMAETRSGAGLALGGFPSVANTTGTSVFSTGDGNKKSSNKLKKKKDPSLTDLGAGAEETKVKPKVTKAKTLDENGISKIKKEEGATVAIIKSKNPAQTKPPVPKASVDQKTKPQVQAQQAVVTKSTGKANQPVEKVENKKDVQKQQVENKEKKEKEPSVSGSSQSSRSSSVKYESDNKIDEEAEDDEEEEKKVEVIPEKGKQIENNEEVDNQSQLTAPTNNGKSTEVSSLTNLQESDLQSSNKTTTEQSSRATTPGMQISNNFSENKPTSLSDSQVNKEEVITPTSKKEFNEEDEEEEEQEEEEKSDSLKIQEEDEEQEEEETENNKNRVEEAKPKTQEKPQKKTQERAPDRQSSWPSYAYIDPDGDTPIEGKQQEGEEDEEIEDKRKETILQENQQEEEVKTMPKTKQFSVKSIVYQEKAEAKDFPYSPSKNTNKANPQRTPDQGSTLLLDYTKPGYYSTSEKKTAILSQPEISNSNQKGYEEPESDLRAAFLSSPPSQQHSKERTASISSSHSKGTGPTLPKIDTTLKGKDKKSGVQSPTKSRERTKLPSIDGGKLSLTGESTGQEIVRHENPRAKKLSEASSPNQTRKPSAGLGSPAGPNTGNSSGKTPQKDQENTNTAPGQKRSGSTAEAKKTDNNQLRTRTQNTMKPPGGGKLAKGSDFPPVADEDIVDYSNFVQSFQQLFSGSWANGNSFDYLGVMREIHSMFNLHTQYVDGMDNMLSKYKPSIAPLELGPNDLISQNNMNHLFMYATKTNIDLNVYLQRQQQFQKNVNLLKYGEDPDDKETQPEAKDLLYYRVVKTKSEVYDIITRSFLRKQNWVELPHGVNLRTTWNLMWTWSKPQIDMNKLMIFQKVNHFPGNKGLVRKDLIKSNFERTMKLGRKAAEAFNILPETYILPKEISKFIEVFYEAHEREGPLNIWIVKPVGKSRGRGISLINDIGGLKYAETMVAQKYLKNPLLLNGYKFDMRIYVLVTSLNPIEAFVYKEGFARLSTVPFNLNVADLDNLFIHLTNSSVQKNSQNVDNMSSDAIVGGTKISLKTLRQRLERKGISWAPIWNQVHEIVAKSLYACQNDVPHNPNAFELFGYDVIIDSNMKCWLLEINSSPSLERMNILDDLVKQQLIDDTIDLVAPLQFDRTRLLQVLERRIGEEQRLKSTINTMNNSQAQLNKDLTYILHGRKMRDVTELPEKMGNYERVVPSEMSDKIQKLIQSYKVQYKNPMEKDNKK